jgi:hypothetical protein
MENAHDIDPRAYAQLGAGGVTQRAADISSLRDQLQHQINRARELGYRAHAAADAVFGSVPSPVTGGADRDRPPPPLAELVNELASALGSIEAGLNRL